MSGRIAPIVMVGVALGVSLGAVFGSMTIGLLVGGGLGFAAALALNARSRSPK
jgi:F0F1-type ATP synthase assembly protein I